MAKRSTGITRIFLDGDKDAAAGLIPLARKYLGVLEADSHRKIYRRTLPDGSTIVVNNRTNPANITIFSKPTEKGGLIPTSGIVCEPSVWSPGFGLTGWGEPYVDQGGNPINPPMGTRNGARQEVVIRRGKSPGAYRVDHREDADVGNIDWIYKPQSSQRKYLSWNGPWGRGTGLGIGSTSDPLFINGYTPVTPGTLTGYPSNRRFWVRWGTGLFMGGVDFATAPAPVFAASIAEFNGVEYVIALCNTTNLVSGDAAFTIKRSDLSAVSPSWTNLGGIDWGGFFNGKVVARDFCNFFSPDGKKAVGTRFFVAVDNWVTLRIEFTSESSFASSADAQPKTTSTFVRSSSGSPTACSFTETVTTVGDFANIASDYDQITGEEIHLQARRVDTSSFIQSGSFSPSGGQLSGGGTDSSIIEFKWPNSSFSIILNEGSGQSTSSHTGDVLEPFTANQGESSNGTLEDTSTYIIDCRYEIFIYYSKETVSSSGSSLTNFLFGDPGAGVSCTSSFSDTTHESLKLNGTIIVDGATGTTSFSFSGTGLECPLPGPLSCIILNETVIQSLPPHQISSNFMNVFNPGLPWSAYGYKFPHVYYAGTIDGDVLLSVFEVNSDIAAQEHSIRLNYLGGLGAISQDSLSILTSLIVQPEYDPEKIPTHRNTGVF